MSLLGSHNTPLTAMMHGEIPSLVRQAKAIILQTLRWSGGDVSAAAIKLQIGRATLSRWIRDNPDLKSGLDKIREAAVAKRGAK